MLVYQSICSAMDLRTSPKHTLRFGFTPGISGGNLFNLVNKCSSWKLSAWGRTLVKAALLLLIPAGRSTIKTLMAYLKWNTSKPSKMNSILLMPTWECTWRYRTEQQRC